jgi:alpha-ketoglutarate-dependent 2,4-dichlorophenoxyacetate dioxygenase
VRSIIPIPIAMKLSPLHPLFAAQAEDIDLTEPVSGELIEQIHQAMNQYAVLVFRGQHLTDDQHMTFAQALGTVEAGRATVELTDHRLKHERMNDISNIGSDGKLLAPDSRRRMFNLGNRLWHTDSSFKPTPAKYSLLYAHAVPETGGDTEFADMRAAWDGLDAARQERALGQVARHSLLYSRARLGWHGFDEEEQAKFAPVPQRLVRRHPGSGRLSLYLASHIGAIDDWPVAEAMIFVSDLVEHATQRQYVFRHQWQQDDLVMWDNRCTMHRATAFDDVNQPRDVRRVTLTDSAPTLKQPL